MNVLGEEFNQLGEGIKAVPILVGIVAILVDPQLLFWCSLRLAWDEVAYQSDILRSDVTSDTLLDKREWLLRSVASKLGVERYRVSLVPAWSKEQGSGAYLYSRHRALASSWTRCIRFTYSNVDMPASAVRKSDKNHNMDPRPGQQSFTQVEADTASLTSRYNRLEECHPSGVESVLPL